MNIFVTGHRPNKLGGYSRDARKTLEEFCVKQFVHRLGWGFEEWPENLLFLIGMAQGFDQAMAHSCAGLGIPFDAYVPCLGQEKPWPQEAQERYHDLLRKARKVVYVSKEPYQGSHQLLERNKAMVVAAERGIALWNGSPGGTAHAGNFARSVGVPVENWWSAWRESL